MCVCVCVCVCVCMCDSDYNEKQLNSSVDKSLEQIVMGSSPHEAHKAAHFSENDCLHICVSLSLPQYCGIIFLKCLNLSS